MSNSTWQQFFDAHAPEYMSNVFVTNTVAEADFIVAELKIAPGDTVLDMGCGTGRHSVELAKRGMKVTGVDLSEGMLAEARKEAEKAGVEVIFVQADATRFSSDLRFDAAICVCEGSFGLLGQTDDPIEHDLAILRSIHAALKPGGRFLLTALSALRTIRQYTDADVASGKFDPMGLVEAGEMQIATPEGPDVVPVRERAYVAGELKLMCRLAGLDVQQIWGGTAGNWGHRQIEMDEYELMLIARKP